MTAARHVSAPSVLLSEMIKGLIKVLYLHFFVHYSLLSDFDCWRVCVYALVYRFDRLVQKLIF